MRLFIALFLFYLVFTPLKASTFSAARLEIDFVPIIKPNYNRPDDSISNYYTVNKQSGLGIALSLFFKDTVFGLGLLKGKYKEDGTATYPSLSAESGFIAEDEVTVINGMLRFGKEYSFVTGLGLVVSGESTLTNSNPVCRSFDESGADVSGFSYFLSMGFPIANKTSVTFGARALILKAKYKKQGYAWPHYFLFANIGLEYHF